MTKRKILVSVIFALIFYSAVKKISITFFSNLLEIDASGYWIIVYFLSAAFLGFILKYQTNRQDIENRIIEYFKILNYIKVNIVILTFIVFWFLTPLIAKNEIGATFEKSEYQTRYYVNLFPQKDSIENYRVLADISAHYNEYHIKKAYFNNDEYITFNNENEYNSYTVRVLYNWSRF